MKYTLIDNDRVKKGLYNRYENLYYSDNLSGDVYYKCIFNGKSYGFKNITRLRNATLKTANAEVIRILDELQEGINPFIKKKAQLKHLKEYFLEYMVSKSGLSEKGKDGKNWFYNKHLKKYGNLSIKQINVDVVQEILDTTLKGKSDRLLKELKSILMPIFRSAARANLYDINLNPFLDEDVINKMNVFKKDKVQVQDRITDLLAFARLLYLEAIVNIENLNPKSKKYKHHIEAGVAILIAITTARRRGEILSLRWDNIRGNEVRVDETQTKTKKIDFFILPSEVVSLLPYLKTDSKKVFSNVEEHMVTLHFRKLVQKVEKQGSFILPNRKVTLHNTRDIFSTLMLQNSQFSPYIIDRALSHKQKSIMSIYMNVSEAQLEGVFSFYIDLLAGFEVKKMEKKVRNVVIAPPSKH